MRSTILVGVIAALFSTAYTATTAPTTTATTKPTTAPKNLVIPPNGQAFSVVANYSSSSSVAQQWKDQGAILKLSWDLNANAYSEQWTAYGQPIFYAATYVNGTELQF